MESEIDYSMLYILFVFINLLIGGVCKEINKKTKIPYTPMLFMIGILLGVFVNSYPELKDLAYHIVNINPESILFCFLPILIYDSA